MNASLIFLIHVGAYLAVGLWASAIASRHHYIPKHFIATTAFGFIAVFYYLLFFLTLANRTVALCFSYMIYVCGWGIVLYSLPKIKGFIRNKDILVYAILPLSIILLLLGYYSFLLGGCRLPTANIRQNDNLTYCYIRHLPVDNTLPYLYAQNVLQDRPHSLIGNWRLVDRPPIQMGAAIGILNLNNNQLVGYRAYQLIGVFLQLSWVSAVFGILICLGLKSRQVILAIGAMSFTGFFFINSVFVWPKFFAGSLVAVGCVMLLSKNDRHYSRTAVAATISVGLGLLIHGGVVFTVIGTAIVLAYIFVRNIYKKGWPSPHSMWLPVAISCLILAVLLTPWMIYKNVSSPSDRLVKWYVAGVVEPDNRSTSQTIIDSYTNVSFRSWLDNRQSNFLEIVTPRENQQLTLGVRSLSFSWVSIRQSIGYLSDWYMTNSFYIVFFALGFFNAGWIVLLSRKQRSKVSILEKRLTVMSATTLLLWVLIMFLPGITVIHQGSYAMMLIIFSLLALWISRARLILPLFIILFLLFSVLYVAGIFIVYGVSLHQAIPSLLLSVLVLAYFIVLSSVSEKLYSL